MNPSFKLDYREFNATLEKYRQFHKKKSAAEIVNKKALYIARGAVRETIRPTKSKIQESIGRLVFDIKRAKSGKGFRVTNKRQVFGSMGQAVGEAPIAALIINFIRGKRGEKGLYGADMRKAINRLVGSRVSAIAYLASGWIPAIKMLSPLVKRKSGIPTEDKDAKKIKNPKGDCQPAKTSGSNTVAKLISSAVAHFTTTADPLGKIAQPALQRAINKEAASMRQDIEENMRRSARECGIKTN